MTPCAPQNMINTHVIITLDIIIIFQWNFHNIVVSRYFYLNKLKNYQFS